jgi:hypothetical protein
MYQNNLNYDPFVDRSRILKEVHYYVSNEKEHDTFFIQHAFKLHW